MGNKGYRRYLATEGVRFVIDEEVIEREARYDGKWVLRTNTDLDTDEVALRYKQLWTVEAMFRTTKSLLQTRGRVFQAVGVALPSTVRQVQEDADG